MAQIILEGNECVFKTTIANKLSEKLNYKVLKGSSFELATASNERMFTHLLDVLRNDNVIIDRHIYSNLTYASIFNKYTLATHAQASVIEDMIYNGDLDRKVIYLYAHKDTVIDRLRVRGDEYINEHMVEEINEKFYKVVFQETLDKWSLDNFHMFNTEVYNSDQIVDTIVEMIVGES